MISVLVTGATGQLGKCFQKIAGNFPDLEFSFKTSAALDITDKAKIQQVFSAKKYDYCINCAAYTDVEKAEDEKKNAFTINAEAVKNLAETCKETDTVLIHFSTDYVFDGKASGPYSETDITNPINVYGASKLKGEEYINQILEKYYIFRTSWLYSEFGNNFFNTILKKARDGATLNITTSQKGTPTNAFDLAKFVLEIINKRITLFGLYHFSNKGEATWYDFATAILKFSGLGEKVILHKTGFYKTRAVRPAYSVLNKNKVETTFNQPVPEWEKSLKNLF